MATSETSPASAALPGVTGAPGIAIGRVVWLVPSAGAAEAAGTLPWRQRLEQAQAEVARHLDGLAAELAAESKPEEAAIFEAQAMLASDPALLAAVEQHLDRPLQEAVVAATEALAEQFAALDNAYLRERAADVRAVGQQIAAVLVGGSLDAEPDVAPGAVVLADELSPAQLAVLRRRGIAGLATARGGATGHLALLARTFGLPSLVGVGDRLRSVLEGSLVIVAASDGQLIVGPSPEDVSAYQRRAEALARDADARQALRGLPAVTADGHRLALWANIGRPEEARAAVDVGADGIGLMRTEFLFLDRASAPGEDEQYAAYVAVLHALADRPAIVRTLDIGGDKPLPYVPRLDEANPFLGTRGIRYAMHAPDLLRVQLRALLRAAAEAHAGGGLHVMLPMVATPADVVWARGRLQAAAEELAVEGLAHRADVPLGIMVETPAAALTLDRLAAAGQLSFCSIGSNDLAQYTLAADRGEAGLAQRYRHDDPAVFRLIRQAVVSAGRLGLAISLCGELAADPAASVALVGLGLDKLSMAPPALLAVKAALRGVSLDEARERAARACAD